MILNRNDGRKPRRPSVQNPRQQEPKGPSDETKLERFGSGLQSGCSVSVEGSDTFSHVRLFLTVQVKMSFNTLKALKSRGPGELE